MNFCTICHVYLLTWVSLIKDFCLEFNQEFDLCTNLRFFQIL
jgi:hypothetical protein